MRKLYIVIVVVIVAAGLLYYLTRDTDKTETVIETTPSEDGTFRPNPSNATFTFDDGSITLSAGRNEREIESGSGIMEETVLLDKLAYGDINADNKEDTALFLARYGAGSGTFVYLAAFVSGPVTYRGSKTVFVGDRIAPQSISINEGAVTIKYLDRRDDEPFTAEPTVQKTRQFVYINGEFQER
jgi:hypothetical protein